ncbi:MAG: hypothetical protein ABW046_04645 [Actinoplanes sp.]
MLVTVSINGVPLDLDIEPYRTLAEVLPERGLGRAHQGCADGTCGECTVLVDGEAVRSCLMLAVQCDGADVRTVEGLSVDHPLRAALRTAGAGECERCIPGLVMLAAGAMDDDPERLGRLLAANVCRRAEHEKAEQIVIRAAAGD